MAINYNNIDKNKKINIINQNIYQSKYGMYKHFPLYKPIKISLSQCNIEIYDINKIPQVFVINKHPLNVVEELGRLNEPPFILHVVDRSFDGNGLQLCNGLKDHSLLLRTNFNATFSQNNPFPLENIECIYIKSVVTIRGRELNGLKDDETFNFSLGISAPIYRRNNINEPVSSDNFIKTICIIDTIFKVAIMQKHSILVLTNFGDDDDDKNSTDDIITIYNACILKYGHMFTSIIIAIPEYENVLYNIYSKNIIIPKNL
jgi:hypothetical protein